MFPTELYRLVFGVGLVGGSFFCRDLFFVDGASREHFLVCFRVERARVEAEKEARELLERELEREREARQQRMLEEEKLKRAEAAEQEAQEAAELNRRRVLEDIQRLETEQQNLLEAGAGVAAASIEPGAGNGSSSGGNNVDKSSAQKEQEMERIRTELAGN